MAFTGQTRKTEKWLDLQAIEILGFLHGRTASAPEHVRQEMPQPSTVNAAIANRVACACGLSYGCMVKAS